MGAINNFLTRKIFLSEGLSIQIWMFVAMFFALVLVAVVLISSTKNSSKNRSDLPDSEPEKTPTPEEASKQYFEIINSSVGEDIQEKSEEKNKASAKIVNLPEVTVTQSADENVYIKEFDSEKNTGGKFIICNSSIGGFRYLLIANNGQLLYESRDYKAKNTCEEAIGKFLFAVREGVFSVKKDKFDRYKFNLRPPKNYNTVYVGESFKTKAACLSNIESVKRFFLSPVIDKTSDDFIAEGYIYDVPENVIVQVENTEGAKGKWEIIEIGEDELFYEYLLYANNGQLLYESKEYRSYSSCKSGLETFISTVKNGTFIVDSDKAGRFKFILRSNKSGSQAEYVGQFYASKASCESNIESVYKFALLSSYDAL